MSCLVIDDYKFPALTLIRHQQCGMPACVYVCSCLCALVFALWENTVQVQKEQSSTG